MTSAGERTRAIIGYGILFIVGLFELIVFILGAINYGGDANKTCVGSVANLTLPLWMLIGGIIGAIINSLYLCLYTPSVCCDDQTCCGLSDDRMGGLLMCLFTGPVVACFFFLGVAFRFAWFIIGCVILSSVAIQCTLQYEGLKILGIFYLVSMVLSSIGKLLVSLSVCPCCR